ncbi:MAG: hypothetical protein EOO52_12325 [Gammaproteobacteria bacterium]|nr:MAG: hypothetical protein EOO52_12325 [Gammaproteobacteria bacterium]
MSNESRFNAEQKNPLRAVAPSAAIDEPLALLDFGDMSLLVSSKDIFTLMSTQKMMSPTLTQACGEIVVDENCLPVFAMNKTLQLSSERPSSHLTLVVLQHQTLMFGWCCVTLEKIDMQELQFFPVPVSMSSRKQPFSHFAVINHRAAGLTSAAGLLQLLEARGVVFPDVVTNNLVQEAI